MEPPVGEVSWLCVPCQPRWPGVLAVGNRMLVHLVYYPVSGKKQAASIFGCLCGACTSEIGPPKDILGVCTVYIAVCTG